MTRTVTLLAIAAILLAALTGSARAATLADYTFGSGVDKAWSTTATVDIDGRKVLGLFNNRTDKTPSSAVLSLTGLPPETPVEVSFDLYYVGCWDSDGDLADRFSVSSDDGAVLLEKTSFPCRLESNDEKRPLGNVGTLKTRKYVLGYWIETLSFTVAPSHIRGGAIKLEFLGSLTGRSTEFWALDNVRVASSAP